MASSGGGKAVLVTRAGMGIRERMASLVGKGGAPVVPGGGGGGGVGGGDGSVSPGRSIPKALSPRKWGTVSSPPPPSSSSSPSGYNTSEGLRPVSPRPSYDSSKTQTSATFTKGKDCKLSIKLPSGATTLLYLPRNVALDNVKGALWNQGVPELALRAPDDFWLAKEGGTPVFKVEFLKLRGAAPDFAAVIDEEGVVMLELVAKPSRGAPMSPSRLGGQSNPPLSAAASMISPRVSRGGAASPPGSRGPLGVRGPAVGFTTPRIGRLPLGGSTRISPRPVVEETIIAGEQEVAHQRVEEEVRARAAAAAAQLQVEETIIAGEQEVARQRMEEEVRARAAKEEEKHRKAMGDEAEAQRGDVATVEEERLRFEEETRRLKEEAAAQERQEKLAEWKKLEEEEKRQKLEQEHEVERLRAAEAEKKRLLEESEKELQLVKKRQEQEEEARLQEEQKRMRTEKVVQDEKLRQAALEAQWFLQEEGEQRGRRKEDEEARQAMLRLMWISEDVSAAQGGGGGGGDKKSTAHVLAELMGPAAPPAAGPTTPDVGDQKKGKGTAKAAKDHKRTESWFSRVTERGGAADKIGSSSGGGGGGAGGTGVPSAVDGVKGMDAQPANRAGSRMSLMLGGGGGGGGGKDKDGKNSPTPFMSRLSGAKKVAADDAQGKRASTSSLRPSSNSSNKGRKTSEEAFIPLSSVNEDLPEEEQGPFLQLCQSALADLESEQALVQARVAALAKKTLELTAPTTTTTTTANSDFVASGIEPLKVVEDDGAVYWVDGMIPNFGAWAREDNFDLYSPQLNDQLYAPMSTREHSNYCANDATVGPLVLTVPHLDPATGATTGPYILWTDRGLNAFHLPASISAVDESLRLRLLGYLLEHRFGVQPGTSKLSRASNPDFPTELCQLESSLQSLNRKFGVLYALEGQSQNDMFANQNHSPSFDKFLDLIGNRVELLGWAGFRGGLDVKHGHTGTHSVYTQFPMNAAGRKLTFDIMFHVNTMLPYNERDLQQLERKRHLGNDIVMIIFLDGDGSTPFDPNVIKSEFNHVFIVVQPVGDHYRVATIYKVGVERCNPFNPAPGVFVHGDTFRRWLLSKCINSERVAIECKTFSQKLRRTRKTQLQLLINAASEGGEPNV